MKFRYGLQLSGPPPLPLLAPSDRSNSQRASNKQQPTTNWLCTASCAARHATRNALSVVKCPVHGSYFLPLTSMLGPSHVVYFTLWKTSTTTYLRVLTCTTFVLEHHLEKRLLRCAFFSFYLFPKTRKRDLPNVCNSWTGTCALKNELSRHRVASRVSRLNVCSPRL